MAMVEPAEVMEGRILHLDTIQMIQRTLGSSLDLYHLGLRKDHSKITTLASVQRSLTVDLQA